MNSFLKKIIVMSLVIFCITATSQAVSEKTAAYGPVGGGIAIGAATGALTYVCAKNPVVAVLVGLGFGGVLGILLDRYLAKLTPTVRLKNAQKIARLMQMDDLFFCDSATIPDSQLAKSHQQCERLIGSGEEVLRLIDLALNDCAQRGVITQCDMLRSATCELMRTIKSKLVEIISREEDFDLRSRAQNLSNEFCSLVSDPFLAYDFATTEDFVSYVTLRFGTSWPLVLARDHIMGLTKSIERFLESVDRVMVQASKKNLQDVMSSCQGLKVKTQPIMQELLNKINVILTHKNYAFQAGLYENAQCIERQRIYAQELARKQREHEESLARQQRILAENLAREQRDHAEDLARRQRWHAERLADEQREFERREKEKNRQLGQQAIDHGSKVTISI